jgi:penicillin-binding protein 1A
MVRWIAIAALAVLVPVGGALTWAVAHYARAVRNLTRGVGDTVFLSADGKPWFRLDEARHDVDLANISLDLQHAVVAVEDRRFYLHPGLDPIGIGRAIVRDLRAGARAEGASTLTQQLARTLFLSNARTIGRKAKEAAIALLLELELTKPQILELYLNRVYLSAGIYGVQAMSESMFRKPASAVTLPEAALLAGLIRAPSTLSPWSNYEGALARSHVVLAQMVEQGFITKAEEAAARQVRPAIQPYRQRKDGASGWAKDYLRQQFRNSFGGDHPPDWTVQTTFDPVVQASAERAVASGLLRLGRPGLQAALVALDPRNGNVLAMVGGADYAASTFNRVVQSRRQPGSAFKPIVYAAALNNGYSPVSELSGLAQSSAPGDPEWIPRNAQNETRDRLTLREALIESNNAAAALLLQRISSKAVLTFAEGAGLSHLPDVPSLALGTGEVSLLELTAAYTTFPAGGRLSFPRGLLAVWDADGSQVFEQPALEKTLMAPDAAYQMVSMLRDVVDHGTGSSVRSLGVQGPVAGKTGTTDDYRDAWFVGFSSSVVAGVWVGFDQPRSIGTGAYAAQIAAPIWADFMKRSASVLPASEFEVPATLETVELCAVSHQQPVNGCPRYLEYFKPGDEVPTAHCEVHEGSFEVRTVRAVGGLLRTLSGKLASLFGR